MNVTRIAFIESRHLGDSRGVAGFSLRGASAPLECNRIMRAPVGLQMSALGCSNSPFADATLPVRSFSGIRVFRPQSASGAQLPVCRPCRR